MAIFESLGLPVLGSPDWASRPGKGLEWRGVPLLFQAGTLGGVYPGMLLALATSHPTKSSAATRRAVAKAVSTHVKPLATPRGGIGTPDSKIFRIRGKNHIFGQISKI